MPLAPKLLGQLLGHAINEGVADLAALPEYTKPIESGEGRRAFAGEVFKYIKVGTLAGDFSVLFCHCWHVQQGS